MPDYSGGTGTGNEGIPQNSSGGATSAGSGAGNSNYGATSLGIAEAFTTPYAGGQWNLDWKSNMSPAQQTYYENLLKSAGKGSAVISNAYINPESFSIAGLNNAQQSSAIAAYKSLLDTQANKEQIQAQVNAATATARQAMGDVATQFAGRGTSSSAANRAAGAVQTQLGTNIQNIYQNALQQAQQTQLAAAQGLGGLETTYAAQDLQRQLANQQTAAGLATTQYQGSLANAQMANQYNEAQLQYMLGLANVNTGQIVATQDPATSLHTDLWGNLSKLWSPQSSGGIW